MHRVKLLLMGLFAVMAVGSVASATASAEAGPFWHHRFSASEEEGKKFNQSEQEKYYGQGKILLSSTILGTSIVLAGELQIKGTLWNEANQGQLKMQAEFHNVIWVGHCQVKVVVPEDYQGHLMWKWNGEAKQLENTKAAQEEQHWDGIIIPGKTTLTATGLSGKNTFGTVTFGPLCKGLENIHGELTGALSFTAETKLGEFRKELTLIIPGVVTLQHFWNGSTFVGLKEDLEFGTNEDKLLGYIPMKTSQEVAVFEK